ncbi:EVE domain-containing protein [Pseudooceanicola sp. 216_PA32_1]|uniref:UPF0310 protein GLS40_04645 n=1 Tax=Pseudooceanicola pacificus TaxID=2676438 RepID=A0A844W2I9_9RHOB|nr:EVE domain-containing protein [Pseudooceanicola pacificus]MWB77305.1 EVE domain-containing protein [Pseudooceanicola pacificus]
MARFWIGVAARAHVLRGVDGGFCQLGHGKEGPVRRLSPGDFLTYYAPRETLEGTDPVQAFVALGQVRQGEAYRAEQGTQFHPWRRDVDYLDGVEAPVRPMLDRLAFVRDPRHWGMAFRRSLFEVGDDDFALIAGAMGLAEAVERLRG